MDLICQCQELISMSCAKVSLNAPSGSFVPLCSAQMLRVAAAAATVYNQACIDAYPPAPGPLGGSRQLCLAMLAISVIPLTSNSVYCLTFGVK